MAQNQRPEPSPPPGPATELVDLFRRLREAKPLRIGQIATRTGYSPSHVSEVLRGLKAASPDAAVRIAQALGADASTVARARRHAEDLQAWKRDRSRRTPDDPASRTGPAPDGFPVVWRLANPDVVVSVLAGDLLDQPTHLAVGFCDTFDTAIADDRVIHSSSLQGQLLSRLFGNDEAGLDQRLAAALAHLSPVQVESREDKPYGKLARYPLGTVAVLGEPRRLIFAVAYGRMGNDLVVRAPVAELWHCYSQLWQAVYQHGQRAALSIPLMGSGLARIDTLDRDNLLRLILLSFVAYSRLQLVCHELRIVVPAEQLIRLDPASLRDFLLTL